MEVKIRFGGCAPKGIVINLVLIIEQRNTNLEDALIVQVKKSLCIIIY